MNTPRRNGPKFYVEDNIDPERMTSLLDVIDIQHTCFNIITKSGKTAETMSQYLIISDLLKKEIGEGWQKHIIATTDQRERQPDQDRHAGRLPHVRHPRWRRWTFQRTDPRRPAAGSGLRH